MGSQPGNHATRKRAFMILSRNEDWPGTSRPCALRAGCQPTRRDDGRQAALAGLSTRGLGCNHGGARTRPRYDRSEEHTSELQSLMRISYAVFCLKKNKQHTTHPPIQHHYI